MTPHPPTHLWQAAASLAARAHAGQRRKDGKTPYAAHPTRVALTLTTVFGCNDEEILAAALLHDVIEDTTVDYDDLLEHFGPRVADLVAALSKDPRLVEAERERRYDEQLAAAPWEARLIKLADVYDNLVDAHTDAARSKLAGKAARAIVLAQNDPPLEAARTVVAALVEQVKAEFGITPETTPIA
ncbi:MAG: HD domain-containing protein [Planctomycetota bacterium]|jgi:guanosine-3',5'-bis(diphosphate) 3'-pyrophosphohydrolase